MGETISVEKSFELPTDKDWEYLGNEVINNIRIADDIFQNIKITFYCIQDFKNVFSDLIIK